MTDRYILGINAYDHDTSACLLRNGEIAYAIAKERLTRIKHDRGSYQVAVDYCLDAAGITLEQVEIAVANTYVLALPEFERRICHFPNLRASDREVAMGSPMFLSQKKPVITCSHHLAHAYSAFAVSPFDEGAVMVVDGVGSYKCDVLEPIPGNDGTHPYARESESYYRFEGTELTSLKKVFMGPTKGLLSDEFYSMQGVGALYSRVSLYVFANWNKCGEVMGLAAYGRPVKKPLMQLENGVLKVPDWGAERRNPWLRGQGDWEKSPHLSEWEDLARQVQEDTERVLIDRANWLHAETGSKNLCIAGGVGLNCVANNKLLEETPFENIWIQPAAGDDGIAIGCAYYGHYAVAKNHERRFIMKDAFLGREYGDDTYKEAFKPWSIRIGSRRRKAKNVTAETARLLADGSVIGWFQGRSEFGPRALGNRSILADPRSPKMKDHINACIKGRQAFRPFAPIVIAEKAQEYFEGEAESPFMLLAKRVRPEAREKVPAIVHVDGTARVQTVRRDYNPKLYALLEAFEALTGVPVLLNTSFNIRGEPIVESPIDAVDCFHSTRLDALVMQNWIITHSFLHKMFFPIFRLYSRALQSVGSEALMKKFASEVMGQ